jgi:hypothetical protein
MVATNSMTVVHESDRLSYADACEIARRVRSSGGLGIVRLDLTRTCDTETGALARLVVLRRDLRRAGGDLCIVGLRGRANALYEINRMSAWLPRREPRAPRSQRPAAGRDARDAAERGVGARPVRARGLCSPRRGTIGRANSTVRIGGGRIATWPTTSSSAIRPKTRS